MKKETEKLKSSPSASTDSFKYEHGNLIKQFMG